jgi:hypothetical protein
MFSRKGWENAILVDNADILDDNIERPCHLEGSRFEGEEVMTR